ncbi:MAG: GWxTD domain-containing protein [Ignavibacteriales bacterium]|nr:GWxTD domain-containing protein [Ignavibacteriales bacterium]
MKKTFLLSFIFICQLFAQPDFVVERDKIQSGKFFNSEVHFFPADQNYLVYYSYKISYSQLFFEKKDDSFTAGFNVKIEIKDSAGHIVERAFDDRNITVKDFDITNSNQTYLQGVINFKLPEGKYALTAIISDEISKRERRIPPIALPIKKTDMILTPIVFEPDKRLCDKLDSYILSNNSSSIQFNEPTNDLVIPVTDQQINNLTITVHRGDTVFVLDEKITDFFPANPEIKLCDSKIMITQSTDTANVKVFVVRDFSSKLTEGPIQIDIYPNEMSTEKQSFDLNVIWIGKPFSLSDPEEAIKFLEIIETKDVVSNILSGSGSDIENLNNYWRKQDPTPETEFNELMNEFYTRVDYCEINFKPLSGNGGAKSDRGRTYIKFGPPETVDRYTDNNDKVLESWTYKKNQRKFVFVDKDGTGKFTLANGQ